MQIILFCTKFSCSRDVQEIYAPSVIRNLNGTKGAELLCKHTKSPDLR